jgi:aryl-alcohol dehydrogenase-like predicted oxidoreductase
LIFAMPALQSPFTFVRYAVGEAADAVEADAGSAQAAATASRDSFVEPEPPSGGGILGIEEPEGWLTGPSTRPPARRARVGGMEQRALGRTGVQVSELCLGAMMFGEWGNPDHEESIRIIHRALDAGVNFVDTADVYSAGESEEIVARALKGRRDQVVLASKVHFPMGDGPNDRGNSRRWIVQECEASLRRLGTDWIDLYQIHRWDPGTDHDETLGALTDLVRAGKVRYLGSSTYPASEIVASQWTAESRGRERFVCEQPPYSMLVRGVEAEVLPVCQKHGMGVIPWSPLAGGWLTGGWRKGKEPPASTRAERLPRRYDLSLPANQRKLEAADALAQLAEEAGMSLIHMAIAFVLAHPAVTAAIIGPRTMEQLESQLGATDVQLDAALLDRIDEIVPPGTNFSDADAGFTPPALADPALRRR